MQNTRPMRGTFPATVGLCAKQTRGDGGGTGVAPDRDAGGGGGGGGRRRRGSRVVQLFVPVNKVVLYLTLRMLFTRAQCHLHESNRLSGERTHSSRSVRCGERHGRGRQPRR